MIQMKSKRRKPVIADSFVIPDNVVIPDNFVIPAKAGIPHASEIPAFAGMTLYCGSFLRYLHIVLIIMTILLLPSSSFAAPKYQTSSLLLKETEGNAVSMQPIAGSANILLLTSKALYLMDPTTGHVVSEHKFGPMEFPFRVDISGDKFLVTSVFGQDVSSYVFTLGDKSQFNVVEKNIPYFLRVIDGVVVGQRSTSEAQYSGGVFELTWNGNKLQKGLQLDLPKKVAIYDFAKISEDKMWTRTKDGRMRRYEKFGKKWKSVFKGRESYRSNVKCVSFRKTEVMTDRIDDQICAANPPIVVNKGGVETIYLDKHDFFLSGVILQPNYPNKGYIMMLTYSEGNGLETCRMMGNYQGYIADYYISSPTELTVLLNDREREIGGVRLLKFDIGKLDCNMEM